MNSRKNHQVKKFIVIEGLDGAGKSTQINLLKDYLHQQDINYKYLHFPRTDAPDESPIYGEMVANFLKGEYGDVNQVNPYLAALLYAGDRNNAKTMIRQWLEKDYFIVVDRYVYSNMAFQGAKFKDPEKKRKLKEWILQLEYQHHYIPKPTLSIFLHMNFEFISRKLKDTREGADRNYLAGKPDIHESSLELQKNVEREYLHLVEENDDLYSINCFDQTGQTLLPEKIHQKIIDLLIEKKML
ncbi:MAG: dTMP kinase [Candidatus Aminicenantes bacterium]|nr:MAG: dTMP kinase [Candidatus Aminicenantes bacterium]